MKLTIRLDKASLLTFINVLFWCSTPITSAMAAVIGRSPATVIVNITLLLSLVIYCVNTHVRKTWVFLVVYSLIALLIGFTILIHPEYSSWYTHSQYGITKQFLDLGSSIWAFLIIGLYEDEEWLLHDLKIIAALVFLAYMTKFFGAMHRGYWILGTSGRHAAYDMEFGFRILFSTVFWGALGLYKNRKYLFLYFLGSFVSCGTSGIPSGLKSPV